MTLCFTNCSCITTLPPKKINILLLNSYPLFVHKSVAVGTMFHWVVVWSLVWELSCCRSDTCCLDGGVVSPHSHAWDFRRLKQQGQLSPVPLFLYIVSHPQESLSRHSQQLNVRVLRGLEKKLQRSLQIKTQKSHIVTLAFSCWLK